MKPPKGLGPPGRALWRTVMARYELDPGEGQLLAEACRVLDRVEQLQGALDGAELLVTGSTGQPRVNPLLAELRAERLAFARLVGQLRLPQPGSAAVVSDAMREVASARWKAGRRGA